MRDWEEDHDSIIWPHNSSYVFWWWQKPFELDPVVSGKDGTQTRLPLNWVLA